MTSNISQVLITAKSKYQVYTLNDSLGLAALSRGKSLLDFVDNDVHMWSDHRVDKS